MKDIVETKRALFDGLAVLLGVTALTQFFAFLWEGVFTPEGWLLKLKDILQYWQADSLIYKTIGLLTYYPSFLAPLFGFFCLLGALSLILLFRPFIGSLLVGFGFMVCWIFLWPYPGAWTYEYFFPAWFGLCLAFGYCRAPAASQTVFKRIGFPDWVSILVLLLLSCFLFYIISLAYASFEFGRAVGGFVGVSFFLLSMFHIFSNKWFAKFEDEKASLGALLSISLNLMLLSIGAMLLMQVFANHHSGLFAPDAYKALVESYALNTHCEWLKPFLSWSAQNTAILLPVQAFFETLAAVLLVLFVLRAPVLLWCAGLFGLLAFTELGVSATWPPAADNLTWVWELFFVTVASFWMGMFALLTQERSLKGWILGEPLFYKSPLVLNLFLSVLAGFVLYFIGVATEIFGEPYRVISLQSGIAFAFLLGLRALLEHSFSKQIK